MFSPEKVGQNVDVGFTASETVQVTQKMVKQFAEMSGDYNPIHFDEAYAATTRFKKCIAHGMIVGALISRTLNDGLGRGGIYLAQSLKFVNPVFIDDTLKITLTVTNFRKEKKICLVQTIVTKQTNEIVVKGEATIMMA